MKKNTLLLHILLICFLFSCKQNNDDLNFKNPLIGTWYLDERVQINDETIMTYVRVTDNANLKENLSFEDSNNYYLRSPMSSFCMTPPITFLTIEGKWSRSNDMILLKNQFNSINYRIIFVDNNALKVSILK